MEICGRVITVETTSVREERFSFLQWIRRFYSEDKWKRNKWYFKDENIPLAFRRQLKVRLTSGIALLIYILSGAKYLMIILWLSKKHFKFLRGKPKTECEQIQSLFLWACWAPCSSLVHFMVFVGFSSNFLQKEVTFQ